MKVLFVASGNSENFEISPFIKSQAESLIKEGIEIDFFPVRGHGLKGYLKSAKKLRHYVKIQNPDLIHSHYTLCGLSSIISFSGKPIVHSFMGSDVYGEYTGVDKVKWSSRYLTLLTWLIQPFLKQIIVKSSNLSKFIYQKKKEHVIPNGVNIEQIEQIKSLGKKALGWDTSKQQILFLGDPANQRKNFSLVKDAVRNLDNPDLEIIAPYPIAHNKVIEYLKTTDVFVMASVAEGSPNVVKEAMACNCPLVATDVGDVAWVLEETSGCYLSSFQPEDYAEKLTKALVFAKENKRTKGLQRLKKLKLDTKSVADRIIRIYERAL
jgi:glycosyltransferase involved in cell wall biosynthesis